MASDITPKELDCIALLAQGLGSKEIAREMGISTQTVKNVLWNARKRTGALTSAHLISLCYLKGYLVPMYDKNTDEFGDFMFGLHEVESNSFVLNLMPN